MTNYSYVIFHEYPEAAWKIEGNEYGTLVFNDMETPSQAHLDQLWNEKYEAMFNFEQNQIRRSGLFRREFISVEAVIIDIAKELLTIYPDNETFKKIAEVADE